jgi:predicted kinase
MAKLIIMRGLPGSGKSTKAEEIIKAHGNCVRINKDLLRTMLHFDKFSRVNEGQTREASILLAKHFLANNVNVVIDDTNLNPKTFQAWKDAHDNVEVIDVSASVSECVDRDFNRDRSVGEHVIKKTGLQYKNYLAEHNVVVCDLDGTLCDIKHRLQYAKGETKDWGKFFSLLGKDTLRKDVLDKLLATAKEHKAKIVFVSARPETYRYETESWLKIHLQMNGLYAPYYELLIMRDAHDKREDTIVKREIYDKYLSKTKVVKVFDDRPSVIRMWRELGLDVEDVGEGIEF